ncbi:MAG: hypothetical protein JWR71_2470 [Pseudarthrobacter sp.]|nr:hypothetical protein [Pseudarthrobacter sp.]
MSIDPHVPLSHASGGGDESTLICGRCGTDKNLLLHSIAAARPPVRDMVEVGYSCTTCRLDTVRLADVADVAAVLNRTRSPQDVLVFGGNYIHCGQPMQRFGAEIRRLVAPMSTDRAEDDALDIYLRTRVLRCACGFQIELPD